ncbi:MAG: PaaI family thioesterase [bacterium]|nr:PaaI family thioesterase [bacterium]
MNSELKEVLRYSNCFVCGDKNEHGLKARFYFNGEEAFCELKASDAFEGYRGIYHGGVISALLDEVMIKAILAIDKYAVTAEMTVRFIAPVRVGDELRFRGKVIKSRGKIYLTEGDVANSKGEILASANGKYIEASQELKTELMQSID